jgi:hypothetical protein
MEILSNDLTGFFNFIIGNYINNVILRQSVRSHDTEDIGSVD